MAPTVRPAALLLAALSLVTSPALRAQDNSGGSSGNSGPPAASKQPDSTPRTQRSSRSEGGNRFDGAWTFVVISTNCGGSAIVPALISGGRLTAKGATGEVSSSGAYRGVAMGADGVALTASGRFAGNAASGSYRRADGCVGRWTASRN